VQVLDNSAEEHANVVAEISGDILSSLKTRVALMDNNMIQILKILKVILLNLSKDPYNTKFQKIKLNNPKIDSLITSNPECMTLLEIIGFHE
jgi:hypothetical protein